MSDEKISRRQFVQTAATGAVSLTAFGLLLTGCDKEPAAGSAAAPAPTELDCTDVSALTDAEKQTRQSLGYVELSPQPAKNCANCQLYVAPAGDGCGGCTVIKGPINPKGYCNSWVQKQA